jgi:hypothetical protein
MQSHSIFTPVNAKASHCRKGAKADHLDQMLFLRDIQKILKVKQSCALKDATLSKT